MAVWSISLTTTRSPQLTMDYVLDQSMFESRRKKMQILKDVDNDRSDNTAKENTGHGRTYWRPTTYHGPFSFCSKILYFSFCHSVIMKTRYRLKQRNNGRKLVRERRAKTLLLRSPSCSFVGIPSHAPSPPPRLQLRRRRQQRRRRQPYLHFFKANIRTYLVLDSF